MNNSNDFHTVQDLKFDISKLQKALLEVLKIKDYGAPSGITNFAAICLNQIPGNVTDCQLTFTTMLPLL